MVQKLREEWQFVTRKLYVTNNSMSINKVKFDTTFATHGNIAYNCLHNKGQS